MTAGRVRYVLILSMGRSLSRIDATDTNTLTANVQNNRLFQMSEWAIKFNGLSGASGQRSPYSPYKPYNHSLYKGFTIFSHIDNTQSTGHNEV